MSVNITPFSFEGFAVRTIQIDGEPWFVAADVCDSLTVATEQTRRLDEDEKGLRTVQTLGGPQDMLIINESGLYSLILTSRKPEAKRFKKWVTSEVLPSIRKTGSYSVQAPAVPQSLSEALRLAADQAEQIEAQQAQLAIAAPKAEALDLLTLADGAMCITNAAKSISKRPKDLFAWMQSHDWIYRRPGGSSWCAYQERIKSGLLTHKVTTVSRSDGTEKIVEQVLVTAKGLAKLAEAAA